MAAGSWAYGLLYAIKDEKEWVISNDEIVVIKDKFPKAMFHYLVIPKQNISTIFQVCVSLFLILWVVYVDRTENYWFFFSSSQKTTWICYKKCI